MKIGYLLQEGVPDIRKRPGSGPAQHVIQVIKEFQRAGHSVSLLGRFDQKLFLSNDLEQFTPVAVSGADAGLPRLFERAVRRAQSGLRLAYANYFESRRFALACRQELAGVDVFYERMGWLGFGGGLAAEWLKIPLVLEVNGDHQDEFKSQGLQAARSQALLSQYLMRRAARRVTHVVAAGAGWKQRYIERWNYPPERVSVVENGSVVVDLLGRAELKSFQPAAGEGPVEIAYCGGFEEWHGLPVLIQAARIAVDAGCRLRVTLIGSGSGKEKIVRLIDEAGLHSVFHLTGQLPVEQMAKSLARADIGVSPYCGRVEYSGLKLLDYKSAGLAVIASGDQDQPAVIAHGRTGWIVPPCDPHALAKAILHLAQHPEVMRQAGRQARVEAETLHSWRHTACQIMDIFGMLSR